MEEFKGIPNNKKLEQSNMQIKEEIVKVKQQKKMPEPTQKEDMSVKDMLRIIMERNKQIHKKQDKMREDNKRHHETLMKQIDESIRKLEETRDSGFKNLNETLDSTSEGIKEDQNALLSANKSNRDKEKMMHIEINIKGVKKQIIKKTKEWRIIHPKKFRNTREGLDMIRSGLINVFNLTIVNYRERTELKNYRKNLINMEMCIRDSIYRSKSQK